MAECARQLGLKSSVIRRPLRAMVKARLVEADEESLERGTRYRLRPELIERVEQEVQDEQPQGSVLEDQVVFMVECERLLGLAEALISSELTRSVIWVAELDAGGRFLVILDGQRTSRTMHSRLRTAIEKGGGTCRPGRVSRVMDAETWRGLLATSRDAGT